MRLKASVEAFNYWNQLCGYEDVPFQKLVKLSSVSHLVPKLFILEVIDSQLFFRLAGTEICAVFECELRGKLFSKIWNSSVAQDNELLVKEVIEDVKPLMISALSKTVRGQEMDIEIILMPLRSGDMNCDRILGCFSIDSRGYRCVEAPIRGLQRKDFVLLSRQISTDILSEYESFYVSPLGKESSLNYDQQGMLHFRVFNGNKAEC